MILQIDRFILIYRSFNHFHCFVIASAQQPVGVVLKAICEVLFKTRQHQSNQEKNPGLIQRIQSNIHRDHGVRHKSHGLQESNTGDQCH